jgi:hypothetical protein
MPHICHEEIQMFMMVVNNAMDYIRFILVFIKR